ncbi:unnamed protein product [Caenorhabditis auriculariae]|uniref:Uncharacterized protein n=1 Tax=Caenorhabditis auriculariae TaxID=2777116 RepID=A0A8S1HWF3_9PELO|nr:unnamed protein product [Caenorhabditis auriculariae]
MSSKPPTYEEATRLPDRSTDSPPPYETQENRENEPESPPMASTSSEPTSSGGAFPDELSFLPNIPDSAIIRQPIPISQPSIFSSDFARTNFESESSRGHHHFYQDQQNDSNFFQNGRRNSCHEEHSEGEEALECFCCILFGIGTILDGFISRPNE